MEDLATPYPLRLENEISACSNVQRDGRSGGFIREYSNLVVPLLPFDDFERLPQ